MQSVYRDYSGKGLKIKPALHGMFGSYPEMALMIFSVDNAPAQRPPT